VTKKEKKHAHENPAHPGRIVQSVCLEALGLSVTAGQNFRRYAEARNNLINGNSGISPQMAIRLMKAFGGMEETGCGCSLPMTLPLHGQTTEKSSAPPTRSPRIAPGLTSGRVSITPPG
jgi:hypothetical protein